MMEAHQQPFKYRYPFLTFREYSESTFILELKDIQGQIRESNRTIQFKSLLKIRNIKH